MVGVQVFNTLVFLFFFVRLVAVVNISLFMRHLSHLRPAAPTGNRVTDEAVLQRTPHIFVFVCCT